MAYATISDMEGRLAVAVLDSYAGTRFDLPLQTSTLCATRIRRGTF